MQITAQPQLVMVPRGGGGWWCEITHSCKKDVGVQGVGLKGQVVGVRGQLDKLGVELAQLKGNSWGGGPGGWAEGPAGQAGG